MLSILPDIWVLLTRVPPDRHPFAGKGENRRRHQKKNLQRKTCGIQRPKTPQTSKRKSTRCSPEAISPASAFGVFDKPTLLCQYPTIYRTQSRFKMAKAKYERPVAIDLTGSSVHGQTSGNGSCSAGDAANQTEGLCLIGPAPSSGRCSLGFSPATGACEAGSAPTNICLFGGAAD